MGLPQDPPMEDSDSSSLKPSSVVSSVKPGINKFPLIPEFLKVRGLVREHIESFDYFVNTGIKRIVEVNNLISTSDPSVFVKFTDVKIGSPLINEGSIDLQATPHLCRLWDRTYAAPIEVTIEYCNGSYSRSQRGYNSNVEVLTRNKVRIGRIPIMLRSRQCVLYGKNEAELAQLGECPLDPGGYFVVKGTEKVILVQEQLSNNRIIIDINKKGK